MTGILRVLLQYVQEVCVWAACEKSNQRQFYLLDILILQNEHKALFIRNNVWLGGGKGFLIDKNDQLPALPTISQTRVTN